MDFWINAALEQNCFTAQFPITPLHLTEYENGHKQVEHTFFLTDHNTASSRSYR